MEDFSHLSLTDIEAISDQITLGQIVEKSSHYKIQKAALKKITMENILKHLYNSADRKLRSLSLDKITDLDFLVTVAFKDADFWVQKKAVSRLKQHPDKLRMLIDHPSSRIRKHVVRVCNNDNLLFDFARRENDYWVSRKAILKISSDHLIWKYLDWRISNVKQHYQCNNWPEFVLPKIKDKKYLVRLMLQYNGWPTKQCYRRIAQSQNLYQALQSAEAVIAHTRKDPEYWYPGINTEQTSDGQLLEHLVQDNRVKNDILRKLLNQITNTDIIHTLALSHENAFIRRDLIERINDQNILKEIAYQDQDAYNQAEACRAITDDDFLKKLAYELDNGYIRRHAARKFAHDNDLLSFLLRHDNDDNRSDIINCTENLDLVNYAVLNDPDYYVRGEAVKKVVDESILKTIVEKEENASVRYHAIAKVEDQSLLESLLFTERETFILEIIVPKIQNLDALEKFYKSDKNRFYPDLRALVALYIRDKELLAEIARNDRAYEVRLNATMQLVDQEALLGIALQDSHIGVRCTAAKRLTSKEYLKYIVAGSPDYNVRFTALLNVDDKSLLEKIASKDPHPTVRHFASRLHRSQQPSGSIDQSIPTELEPAFYASVLTLMNTGLDEQLSIRMALNYGPNSHHLPLAITREVEEAKKLAQAYFE